MIYVKVMHKKLILIEFEDSGKTIQPVAYYQNKKAVAISLSTAICPWNLFCRDHSCVFI